MLKLSLVAPGDLQAIEAEIPRAEPGEVIIETAAVTLCGSDVRVYTGEKTGGVIWPATIGHEFAGRVTEVGDGVDPALLGTLNSVAPWVPCGTCSACRSGRTNMCPNVRVFGYQIPGALSEFVRIPAEAVVGGNLVRLPDTLDPAVGALIEPLACVYNGHLRCRITIGDTVLILGGGPIGILHAKLALRAGAVVVVSEPNEARAQNMRDLGVHLVLNPTQLDLQQQVLQHTDGRGVDVAIVCVGIPALASAAINATRIGGLINLFAGFGGSGVAEMDLNAIHYRQLSVIGNVDAAIGLYRHAAELVADDVVDLGEMITHRFPLSQAREALEFAASGAGIKVAVFPDSQFTERG